MELKTTEEVLKELSRFMFDNGVVFVKSANAENKLVISVYRTNGLYDDYEFEEEVTEAKIRNNDFIKLP